MPRFVGPPKPGSSEFGNARTFKGRTLGGGPDPDIRDIPNHLNPFGFERVPFPSNPEPFFKPGGTSNPAPILRSPILNKIAPKTTNQIKGNIAGGNSGIGLVYGKQRLVGLPVWFTVNGSKIDLVYTFCRGEIENMDTLIIDGRSFDVSSQSGGASFQNAGLVGTGGWCRIFEGTAGQDVGSDASFLDASYTDSVPNFCVVALQLETQSEIKAAPISQFPPRLEAIIKGVSDARDPRASSGYTTNPALHLAHFLETHVDTSKTVDDTSLTDAADFADEQLDSGAKRMESGMWLREPQPIRAYVDLLAEAARCTVWEEEDNFYLIPDAAIDDADFTDIGPSRLIADTTRVQRAAASDVPADVRVLWFDVDAGAEKMAEALGNVSGRISDVRAPWIPSYAQAKRYAIERLNHLKNEDQTITFDLHNQGLRLRRWDGIKFTDPLVGIEDKKYRVMQITNFAPAKWRIVASEYQDATYSDDESSDPITADTNLPDPYDVPDLTGLTVTSDLSAPIDGLRKARASVSWTNPDWFWTDAVHVRVYDTAASPEELVGEKFVPVDKTSVRIPDLDTFTDHRVDARIKSRSGAYGDVVSDTFTTPTSLPDSDFTRWIDAFGSPTLTNSDKTASKTMTSADNFRVDSDVSFDRADDFYFEIGVDSVTGDVELGLINGGAGVVCRYVSDTTTDEIEAGSVTVPAPPLADGDVVGMRIKEEAVSFFLNRRHLTTVSLPLSIGFNDAWKAYVICTWTTGTETGTFTLRPEAAEWDGVDLGS